MIALPDVNLLLALVWSNHRHHEPAHEWFAREAASGWATSLLTQGAFLRLSLNPQIVGVAIDCSTAFGLLDELVAHPDHRYIETAPDLRGQPFGDLMPRIIGYRQMSDATLLYLAHCHGIKLVTFDQAVASLCPWSENLLVLPPLPSPAP